MIPLPENAGEFSDLAVAHYLGNNSYEYFSFSHDGKTGNMTVEERNGREYLVFETASFSPFNVGGLQLVGPGASLTDNTQTDNAQQGTAPQQSETSGTNSNSTAGTVNSAVPPKNTGTTGAGSTSNTTAGSTSVSSAVSAKGGTSAQRNVTVTRAVKTGDEMHVLPYLAAAAAAAAVGAGAVLTRKKRRQTADNPEQE